MSDTAAKCPAIRSFPRFLALREMRRRPRTYLPMFCIYFGVMLLLFNLFIYTESRIQSDILYYKVNTDLTIACAEKAKADGVGQFLFMSSMIVYGDSGRLGDPRKITADTDPAPANFYGDSKFKAEEGIRKLADDNFKVVILRPPMIYGKGSKGNYPILVKMARKLPLFPQIQNERSMLYVGNLCKLISLMILNEEQGIFFPQNAEYVRTSQMVQQIAEAHQKKIHLTKVFNPGVILLSRLGGKFGRLADKAFGNMSMTCR